MIIAADTVVVGANGDILEKPRSEKQHIEMLKSLRDGGRAPAAENQALKSALNNGDGGFGSLGLGGGMRGEGAMVSNGAGKQQKRSAWHKVYTAVAVLAPLESARDPGYAMETAVEETGVKFQPDGRWIFYSSKLRANVSQCLTTLSWHTYGQEKVQTRQAAMASKALAHC